ncbi:MAG: hypothetical protein OXK81_00350 [Chloroflexota bacterium]|nr:hypothetical protein [Chloroflexota bacterium]
MNRTSFLRFATVLVALMGCSACVGGGGGTSGLMPERPGEPVVVAPAQLTEAPLWGDPDERARVPEVQPKIFTSLSYTKTDHYPFDAQNVLEKPAWSDYAGLAAEDYEYALTLYETELARYEAELGRGNCCWEMVKEKSEIASREDVLSFLQEQTYTFQHANSGDVFEHEILVHANPPVVRFVQGTAKKWRNISMRAIDNINAWLPWGKHVTVGTDLDAATSEATIAINESIFPVSDYQPPDEAELQRFYATLDKLPPNTITAHFDAKINVSGFGSHDGFAITDSAIPDWGTQGGVQHELMHSLGLTGERSCVEKFGSACDAADPNQIPYKHVAVFKFPESAMAYLSPYYEIHGLSQIDGETIQTVYTREGLWKIPNRQHSPSEVFVISSDFSPVSLDPWDDTVVRYSGSFSRDILPTDLGEYGYHVDEDQWIETDEEGVFAFAPREDDEFTEPVEPAFGVDWRNGMARPWADGSVTHDTWHLAESGLSGFATWNGELVGFTPRQEAVHGDSALSVNLARLTGSAAFTGLQHWAVGAPPGGTGTGVTWGDGDLAYSINFDGNYFRSTAGDEGYVSGRFVGTEHEGAVGILERADLTGAFGVYLDKDVTSTPRPLPQSNDAWPKVGDYTHSFHFVFGDATGDGLFAIAPTNLSCQEESCWTSEASAKSLGSVTSIQRAMEHVNVPVYRLQGENTSAGMAYDTWGAWLELTAFSVSRVCGIGGECALQDRSASLSVVGSPSGSIPRGIGSASWAGIVTAVDTETQNLILGDASVTIDDLTVAVPNVDVALTGLMDIDAGIARADIRWDGIPVSDGNETVAVPGVGVLPAGSFGGGRALFGFGLVSGGTAGEDYIIGQFFGDGHQEVAGKFVHSASQTAGAFGGKRN